MKLGSRIRAAAVSSVGQGARSQGDAGSAAGTTTTDSGSFARFLPPKLTVRPTRYCSLSCQVGENPLSLPNAWR